MHVTSLFAGIRGALGASTQVLFAFVRLFCSVCFLLLPSLLEHFCAVFIMVVPRTFPPLEYR